MDACRHENWLRVHLTSQIKDFLNFILKQKKFTDQMKGFQHLRKMQGFEMFYETDKWLRAVIIITSVSSVLLNWMNSKKSLHLMEKWLDLIEISLDLMENSFDLMKKIRLIWWKKISWLNGKNPLIWWKKLLDMMEKYLD